MRQFKLIFNDNNVRLQGGDRAIAVLWLPKGRASLRNAVSCLIDLADCLDDPEPLDNSWQTLQEIDFGAKTNPSAPCDVKFDRVCRELSSAKTVPTEPNKDQRRKR